jgi:4-amino-4-deoxy-L-arabinose transferase-like glycosyltransferase
MFRRLTGPQLALALAIVAAAALPRLWWNDVPRFAAADEAVYANTTRQLMQYGFFDTYPRLAAAFLRDPRMAVYPSPLRYGYFALATLASHVAGAGPHTLASLSTICGILAVPLVFFLSLRLFGAGTALLAAAFTAFSCIELALGRRALQDEVVCFIVLLALTLLLLALEGDDGLLLHCAVIAAFTLAFAVKESFLLLYPALLAVLLVYRTPRRLRVRHATMFLLPPLLYYLGFCALAHDFTSFFQLGNAVTSAIGAPYVLQFQAGPPHRPLFDFFVTAPLVSLLAIGAAVLVALDRSSGRRERAMMVFLVVALVMFGLFPSKNLRFTMVIDPIIRILAAWLIATRVSVRMAVAFAAANAVIEVELFYRIFIRGGVYDPVTQALLQAVGAVPHADATAANGMFFPWICAAIFGAAWVWPKLSTRVPDRLST